MRASDRDRLRIASWNVNGLRARAEGLLAWLRAFRPDLLLLQETKIEDDLFPHDVFAAEGYATAIHGQKSFNGVALLARHALEDVATGLPGDPADAQARWIEATLVVDGLALRVASAYLPNGNPAPGPKFDYKLAWMERLAAHAGTLLAREMATVIGGDFNITPTGLDAADPEVLRTDAVAAPAAVAAWHRIVHAGWTDAFRLLHPDAGHYTYWDYQGGAWRRNRGIRIDHLLLSPLAADHLDAAGIERELRGEARPSDHVPVWCELALPGR